MQDEIQMQLFCEQISPNKQFQNKYKSIVDDIAETIRKDSRKFKLDRCILAGSLGKKTSVNINVDIDLVLFTHYRKYMVLDIENVATLKKEMLKEWECILCRRYDKENYYVDSTNRSINIREQNGSISIDIIPALSFSQSLNKQKEEVLLLIKSGKISHDLMSAELIELSVGYAKKMSKFAHDIARIAKLWSYTSRFHSYVRGRSTIIEMLGFQSAREEQKFAGKRNVSYVKAFRRFLQNIISIYGKRIIPDNTYDENKIPNKILSQTPLILDPSNPYNNLLESVSRSSSIPVGSDIYGRMPSLPKNKVKPGTVMNEFLDALITRATETLIVLDDCIMNKKSRGKISMSELFSTNSITDTQNKIDDKNSIITKFHSNALVEFKEIKDDYSIATRTSTTSIKNLNSFHYETVSTSNDLNSCAPLPKQEFNKNRYYAVLHLLLFYKVAITSIQFDYFHKISSPSIMAHHSTLLRDFYIERIRSKFLKYCSLPLETSNRSTSSAKTESNKTLFQIPLIYNMGLMNVYL